MFAPVLLLGLVAAAPRDAAARLSFSAPAGSRPAGPLAGAPFEAVLRSGQIVDPLGKSVAVGANVYGFAVTPDGRYAVVSNGADAQGGGGLTVVDTRSMRIAGRVWAPDPFLAGVAALRDPAQRRRTLVLASAGAANRVYAFDLDGRGALSPDAKAAISIPPPLDERLANFGRAVPSTIVVARDGRHAYVVDVGGANVTTIDLALRSVTGVPAVVGFAPFAAALARGNLLVANEGLMSPGVLASPAREPSFTAPAFEPGRSSSLSQVPILADGTAGTQRTSIQMDSAPDGAHIVGGAHPSAIVVAPGARFAFVAMAGVDRVATVSLSGPAPRVVGGTELRLYDRGPYGTQPDALAVSRDGSRLYVALAGIDAVAVLDAHDPRHLRRLGLLPTGWQPSALALSKDGRRLFVANALGSVDGAGNSVATLERIDLAATSLVSATRRALACQRRVAPVLANAIIPQAFDATPSEAIKHVVLVLAGDRTFDAMLGDLAREDQRFATVAQPALALYAANVTPNLHALAKDFALAANFYNDASAPVEGEALALGGIENVFEARLRGGDVVDADSGGIAPNAYPRLGYLYNTLAERGIPFRDYGVLLSVPGSFADRYSLDVPALGALEGRVDLAYSSDDPHVSDTARAQEFARDYGTMAGSAQFVSIRLPNVLDARSEADALADQDRALGKIVDLLSHRPEWESTAVFVVPESVSASRDHVDPHRSYALVISPYARRGFLGMRHLSMASVLKTEEEVLGLPALSLADALASDMSDFFGRAASVAPFTAAAQRTKQRERLAAAGGE